MAGDMAEVTATNKAKSKAQAGTVSTTPIPLLPCLLGKQKEMFDWIRIFLKVYSELNYNMSMRLILALTLLSPLLCLAANFDLLNFRSAHRQVLAMSFGKEEDEREESLLPLDGKPSAVTWHLRGMYMAHSRFPLLLSDCTTPIKPPQAALWCEHDALQNAIQSRHLALLALHVFEMASAEQWAVLLSDWEHAWLYYREWLEIFYGATEYPVLFEFLGQHLRRWSDLALTLFRLAWLATPPMWFDDAFQRVMPAHMVTDLQDVNVGRAFLPFPRNASLGAFGSDLALLHDMLATQRRFWTAMARALKPQDDDHGVIDDVDEYEDYEDDGEWDLDLELPTEHNACYVAYTLRVVEAVLQKDRLLGNASLRWTLTLSTGLARCRSLVTAVLGALCFAPTVEGKEGKGEDEDVEVLERLPRYVIVDALPTRPFCLGLELARSRTVAHPDYPLALSYDVLSTNDRTYSLRIVVTKSDASIEQRATVKNVAAILGTIYERPVHFSALQAFLRRALLNDKNAFSE